MRNVRFLVIMGLTAGFLGCGQKGPLVLPDAQHPHRKIGAPKPPPSPASAPRAPTGATPAPAQTPPPAPAVGPAAVPASAPADGQAWDQADTTPAPQH